MKSITIHGLDEPLYELIKEQAKTQGTSLNKTTKRLLAESLGVEPSPKDDHQKDFMDLFGVWSEAEAKEFARSAQDFEKIEPKEWS